MATTSLRRLSAITIARWRSCVTNDAFDRSVIAASRIRSGARNYTATSVARHDNHDDDARSHHHGDGDGAARQGGEPLLIRSLRDLGGEYGPFASWLNDTLSTSGGGGGGGGSGGSGGGRVHPSVAVRAFPGMGLGLAAAGGPIKAGDVILRLPRAAWYPVSAELATSQARRRVPQFVSHAEAVSAQLGAPEFAKHAMLALHLLFELGDPTSPARPYLATLPKLAGRESPSVPLLWTPVQVATLRGTPTHAAVLARAEFVAKAHGALFPGGGAAGGVPLEAFAWALSSVLSRAASGASMPYTLMPGVDLINHAAGGKDAANCVLGATRTDDFGGGGGGGGVGGGVVRDDGVGFDEIEVRCTRDVGLGEQLTISYGDAADNDRLLRLYGFAIPGNPNDRRRLELRVEGLAAECWNMTKTWGPGLNMARQAILRMHGLPRLDGFDEVDEVDEDELIREVMKAMGQEGDGAVAEKAAKKTAAVFRDPDSGGGGGGGRGVDGGFGKMDTEHASSAGATTHSHGHGHHHGHGDNCGHDHGHGQHHDDHHGNGNGHGHDRGGEGPRRVKKEESPTWTCYVAHPSKRFPPRPHKPMDSSTDAAQAAVDEATSLAAGESGGAVSTETLLATLRVHLLRGDEPHGPDGFEPNPWAPMSETNEAAVRSVLADAAERSMRAMRNSLLPADDSSGPPAAGEEGGGGEGLEPLDVEDARAVKLGLLSGEDWANAVIALRQGQEDILEHVRRE